jgi:hypothetical protein
MRASGYDDAYYSHKVKIMPMNQLPTLDQDAGFAHTDCPLCKSQLIQPILIADERSTYRHGHYFGTQLLFS